VGQKPGPEGMMPQKLAGKVATIMPNDKLILLVQAKVLP
jgi:hypothetical protein